jgi:TolB protein
MLAYSPLGDQLAFLRLSVPELVIVDTRTWFVTLRVDARAPGTSLPMSQMLSFGGPSWSPDGEKLAFVCWDGAGDEICILDIRNGLAHQVTRLSEDLGGQVAAGERVRATSNIGPPAWSPDGATIAVAAYPERRGAASGLFVIDVAKGSARRLSELQPNSRITWLANSSAVLFSATFPDRSDVLEVAVNGRASVNVTESLPGSFRNPDLLDNGDVVVANSDGAIVVIRDQREVARVRVVGLAADFPAARPGGTEISFQAEPDLVRGY